MSANHDSTFEHMLDVDDLCRQMDRTSLLCTSGNREDILTAVKTTRFWLRSAVLDEGDVRFHLFRRASAYDTYLRLIRFSIELEFLSVSMREFQKACAQPEHIRLVDLLRLAYFIDREICFCAGIE